MATGQKWLTTINILGFRSHKDTQIRGLKRVNWFLGKNATGKSSIIDAIAYAFTGVCRGTDRGGRGADDLVSDFKTTVSPNHFTIGVHYSDAGSMIRKGPGQGPSSQIQEMITKSLGIPPTIVQALTDVTRILDATPKEQQALLEQVLGIQVTKDIVEKALKEHASLATVHKLESLDDLIAFEAFAREQRTTSRRMVDSFGSKIPVPDFIPESQTWTLAQAEERLASVTSKLFAMVEKRGAMASNRGAALKASIERSEKEVASLTKSLDAVPDPAEKIKEVVAEMARRQEVLHAINQAEEKTDKEQDTLRLRLLEANHEACFLCGRKFTGKGYQAAKDAAHAAVEQHGQGHLGRKEHLDALKALERRAAALEMDHDKRRSWNAEIKAKAEAILAMKAELANQEGPQDTTEIDGKIERGTKVKKGIEEVIAVLKHNAKVEESVALVQEQKKAWEEAVDSLATLRSSLVTERIQAFQDKANILLGVMGFKVEFTTAPFEIHVNGRRPVMLSVSQRMRVGLGLQMTLANMAGLRFVCLDAVETFDVESMAALKEIIRKVKQFQFFLCAKADNPAKEVERDEDWAVYSVALKGEQSVVEAI